jgi:hypothetical protein
MRDNAPMDGEQRKRDRLRSFLLGGLVGASAAVAAGRRRRARPRPPSPAGLAAFEGAPCYREIVERERLEAERP